MHKRIPTVIIGAAAIVLLGAANAWADHGALTGDQIKQLVSGATGRDSTARGQSFKTRIDEGGSLQVNISETGFSDVGKWRVNGDTYCSKWATIRKGAERCVTVKHLSGKKYKFETADGDGTDIVITR